jgi:hypothetical protein
MKIRVGCLLSVLILGFNLGAVVQDHLLITEESVRGGPLGLPRAWHSRS